MSDRVKIEGRTAITPSAGDLPMVKDKSFDNGWEIPPGALEALHVDFKVKMLRFLWQDGVDIYGLALSSPVVAEVPHYATWDYGIDEYNEFTEDTADEREFPDLFSAISDLVSRARVVKGEFIGWRYGLPSDFHDDEFDEFLEGSWANNGRNEINRKARENGEKNKS